MNPDIEGFMRKVRLMQYRKYRARNCERYIEVIELFEQYNILTYKDLTKHKIRNTRALIQLFHSFWLIELAHIQELDDYCYPPTTIYHWQVMDSSAMSKLKRYLILELNSLKGKIK